MKRTELIRQRLRAALDVRHTEIEDETHKHAGHAGAAAGGGHFSLVVVSPCFAGRGRLTRHRMVYAAIGDAMRADTIHALSIQALTPEEHRS